MEVQEVQVEAPPGTELRSFLKDAIDYAKKNNVSVTVLWGGGAYSFTVNRYTRLNDVYQSALKTMQSKQPT